MKLSYPIPFSPKHSTASLPLDEAYVSGFDGLVQQGSKLYFHFQRYDWDLLHPENNPPSGEHQRRVGRRLLEGGIDTSRSLKLKGEYILGISPFISSYYHFITDLLPYLLEAPAHPILIPQNMPASYVAFLQRCGFSTFTLNPDQVYCVEHLFIPMLTYPDWNLEKIRTLQDLSRQLVPLPSQSRTPYRRLYVSRKLVKKRHLINEEELLPWLHKYGFQRVFLERLPITEQVQMMRETSHLISPHGAGLVNTLFTPPSTVILEIRPILTSGQFCFEQLCSYGWPHYEYLVPPKRPTFCLDVSLLLNILTRWFPF